MKQILLSSALIGVLLGSLTPASAQKKAPAKKVPTTTTKTTKPKPNYSMQFKQADWIHNTDVYEVNVRQYTPEGTFNAFAKELPRLKEMGVSTLWLMPITPIAQKNMKGSLGSPYACSDYTAINPELGTLEDFKQLVNTAHEMGFKLIIDWVANHTGWDHVWTVSHPEYYLHDPATKDFKIASGMDDIIELDYKNPQMRLAMIDAMRYWIKEADIDGFRCDLASWVELDFWLQARKALEEVKTLFWLAECDPLDNPDYYQAFDACYSWTWMHQTESFYKEGKPATVLTSLLQRYDAVPYKKSMPLWFTTNHDENTWNGTEYEKYGDAAKALAVFSFTWNGIPLIYSGQELPNLKRLKFFDRDPIEWNGQYAMANFYHTLLSLKKNNPALRGADDAVTTYLLENNLPGKVISYLRKNGKDEVLVVLNLSKEEAAINIHQGFTKGIFREVFSQEQLEVSDQTKLVLPAWGYKLYSIQP